MKQMKNFLINGIIFLLIFVGTVILARPLFEEPLIEWFTHVEVDPTEFEANLAHASEYAEFDIESISAINPWRDLLFTYMNEEVAPIGEIIIPSVDIHLPLLHGATNANMSLGGGTLSPEGRMGEGNFGLASHWMPQPGLLFASLYQVEIGDMIFLRDANYVYAYEIFENKIVEIYRGDVLDYVEGRVLVTLVTCTPDMLQRVIVQGELVERLSIEDILSADEEDISDIPEAIDIAEITEALVPVVVTFPIIEVVSVGFGSALLALLVVFIANRGKKKK